MFLLAKLKGAIEMSKSFRLLYSEICSYCLVRGINYTRQDKVFVSYIRRYVLTERCITNCTTLHCCFRLLYSEICSYSSILDEFKKSSKGFRLLYSEICSYYKLYKERLLMIKVFVSYIRRYVLTTL